MKIFVTGANGFIGSHIVPILIRRGYEVTCLVRDPLKAERLAAMGAALAAGDVTERKSMRPAMQGAHAVFHLAGWYALGNVDHVRMQVINVEGARQTLELAAELGVPRILHTSTVGVFGNTHGKIVDETYFTQKDALASYYERTKWEAHYEVAAALQQKGAPVIILQSGGVTGPGDRSPHMQLVDYFLRRSPLMFGAKSGLTYAHVDDIAEGQVLAMEKGKPGETYILCGPALTYRQVFELCAKISGIKATKTWLPGWVAAGLGRVLAVTERLGIKMPMSAESLRSSADYTFWASAAKARRELAWSPRPVEEVFRAVLKYEMNKRGMSFPPSSPSQSR